MGKMNLLKAVFEGKVGENYGARQRKNTYLKAIPFSHAPSSPTQTACVRAFEKLNRLSAKSTNVFYPFINNPKKTVLKHNAVASFLKPLISEKVFDPGNFSQIIADGEEASIVQFSVDTDSGIITISANETAFTEITATQKWGVVVFDSLGTVYLARVPSQTFLQQRIVATLPSDRVFYAIAFTAEKRLNKWVLGNLQYEQTGCVIGGTLYTALTADPTHFEVIDGVLYYTGTMFTIQNGVFILS
ncbi:hypothetical protein IKG45_00020 [Candidatus Saccharibacteria bacterium]|nr:hypothetical protein [Candidatus Saccharibacteria bacterium]